MVTTERSHRDFETAFTNPKAYRIFERLHQRVVKESPRRRRQYFRSASGRYNRAYRAPRSGGTASYHSHSRTTSNRSSNPSNRANQRRHKNKPDRRRDNHKNRDSDRHNSRR